MKTKNYYGLMEMAMAMMTAVTRDQETKKSRNQHFNVSTFASSNVSWFLESEQENNV